LPFQLQRESWHRLDAMPSRKSQQIGKMREDLEAT
jgi:hypothetical protein